MHYEYLAVLTTAFLIFYPILYVAAKREARRRKKK